MVADLGNIDKDIVTVNPIVVLAISTHSVQ
eukprot:COSAG02_NODE_3964_length_5977_cov_24.620619_2_plen_30_part_00